MPSLRLPIPFRRGVDRPSLKQRAAALKATAGSVMRGHGAPAPDDRLEDRPGFMPYPSEAPKGWVNIRYALKEEGERLLRIALRELDRRLDGVEYASDDERRSYDTRLRRELRIDALMALSGRMDPSDEPLPEPGSEAAMAAFHAACGEATRLMDSPLNGYPELRHPKTGWWTKHCLNRALDDGTMTPVEFARLHPLAAEREHRNEAASLATNLGALHALAHAGDYPLVEDEVADPIHAVIAASRAAEATMAEWQARTSALPGAMTEALFAEEATLCEVQSRTRDAVLSTVPTTHAGRLALVEFVRFVMGLYGMGGDDEGADNLHMWKQTHATLMAALAGSVFDVEPDSAPAEPGRPALTAPPLSTVSQGDLASLYDAVAGLHKHALAESSSPGFWGARSAVHTEAGLVLDAECERLGALLDAIADEARRRSPDGEAHRASRLAILLRHELRDIDLVQDPGLLAEVRSVWSL